MKAVFVRWFSDSGDVARSRCDLGDFWVPALFNCKGQLRLWLFRAINSINSAVEQHLIGVNQHWPILTTAQPWDLSMEIRPISVISGKLLLFRSRAITLRSRGPRQARFWLDGVGSRRFFTPHPGSTPFHPITPHSHPTSHPTAPHSFLPSTPLTPC